jgi:HEXXH motif-containing protein
LRVGPVGGDVYLSSASGVDVAVDLVIEDSAWRLCAGGSVKETPRTRVADGIDVLEAASFPELSLIRRSIEVTSTAATGVIDQQLAEVFSLLGQGWPAAMDDVRTFFRGLFPISSGPEHWNSASSDAIPLALQLTFPEVSTPLALGESVVHETAHVKLDLLMTMVPLLDNSADRQYRHPWREDLRPLSGVLIGAHAFLNVVVYYRQMLDAGLGGVEAERELTRRQGEVLTALELLSDRARFTDEGLALFEAMVAVLRRTDCRV